MPPEAGPGRPICVVGMHRSGTTLTAMILQRLGVDFGPAEEMIAAHPVDSPRGYLELDVIRRLNDDVLAALGGDWWHPPRLRPGWERARRLRPHRERAGALAGALFTGARWGFKDPRASLTFPLWESAVGEMDPVICVRDPAEVAASLVWRYRETFPESPGVTYSARDWARVWRAYTRAALAQTRGRRRLVVRHADLVRDGAGAVRSLAAFAGVPVSNADCAELAELGEPGLWRQRADRPGAAQAIRVSRATRRLHGRALATGSPREPESGGMLAAWRARHPT